MKKCQNCGAEMEQDALFCHECGAKQEIEDAEVKLEEPTVEEKFCVHCRKAIEADSMFCPYCGTKVVYTRCCTKCGKPLDEDSDFCPYCGTKQDSVNTESEQIEEVVQPQTTISVQELETVDPSKNQIEELPQEVNENGKVDDVVTSNPEHNEPDSELPHESKNSSKKWLLIVGVILLLGILGGGGYYFMTNKDGGSSYIVETDSIAEIGDSVNTTDDEAAMMDALAARNNAMEIEEKKDFIMDMYKDFFENNNFDTQDLANLKKYLAPNVIERIYLECPYDGCEGEKQYIVDVFYDSSLSYERPDVTITNRQINNIDYDWFEVVGVDKYTGRKNKVQIEIRMGDNGYQVTDFKSEI